MCLRLERQPEPQLPAINTIEQSARLRRHSYLPVFLNQRMTVEVAVNELLPSLLSGLTACITAVFLITLPGAAVTFATILTSAPVRFCALIGASAPMLQTTVLAALVHGIPPDGMEHEGEPRTIVQESGVQEALTRVVPGGRTSVTVTWFAVFGPRLAASVR